MKKLLMLLVVALLAISLVGCDVSYKVLNNDSVVITLECDEDDVDEFGLAFDFDEGDLDSRDDAEDILDDVLDENDDFEGDMTIKSFKRKDDDFVITFKYIPTDDIDDAIATGFAVGNAEDVLDEFANVEYDEDFDDIYDEDLSEDIDDENLYAYDGKGEELSDKEFEKFFDKAKLDKYKAVYIENADGIISVPGSIKMIISPSDDIDIDGKIIESDSDMIVIYGGSSVAPLVTLCILLVLVGVGLGVYFLLFRKKDDGEGDDLDELYEEVVAE